MTVKSVNLGFPRIGRDRELKKALESFWAGKTKKEQLESVAKTIRKENWLLQKEAGIDFIPSNDFSYYDQMLDWTCLTGCIPRRYYWEGGKVPLEIYFAMARGHQKDKFDVPAMTMTKFFNTNYHYIVPEFHGMQDFLYSDNKLVLDTLEARTLKIDTRPIIMGPISFLMLGKVVQSTSAIEEKVDVLDLIPKLLPVYEEIFTNLKRINIKDVQIDEPILVSELDQKVLAATINVYEKLREYAGNIKINLATYFDDVDHYKDTIFKLPVDSVHVDLVYGGEKLDSYLKAIPKHMSLSLGLVNGRNIWINDIDKSVATASKVIDTLGDNRVLIGPSCSLQFSPYDLDRETDMNPELKSWLSFAKQKLNEIAVITRSVNGKLTDKDKEFVKENKKAIKAKSTSKMVHNPKVAKRVEQEGEDPKMLKRKSPFAKRIEKQQKVLNLPALPTTTIGSLPQTAEVRKYRSELKSGKLSEKKYNETMKGLIKEAVEWQDQIGIDVPVHGEFERNDMVEYFGEQLAGYAFTQYGWVQSYGSRCVKPPIIYGDVSRPDPMTVDWTAYAQSLTKRPMKGMLTGPVTMMQWSFVRDDQSRETTCRQIGLAILDEVQDLEKAGIKIIQIDEPAIREGLPIKHSEWSSYLKWAIECFRLSSSNVDDSTQIHTHMCYSEFNDIIEDVANMDADVISIETSRSQMELLDSFVSFKYPNQIGPGIYDIHSPRTPSKAEMKTLLNSAIRVLEYDQIWVNPDCGLKTRNWDEVRPTLVNMVAVAKELRSSLGKSSANG